MCERILNIYSIKQHRTQTCQGERHLFYVAAESEESARLLIHKLGEQWRKEESTKDRYFITFCPKAELSIDYNEGLTLFGDNLNKNNATLLEIEDLEKIDSTIIKSLPKNKTEKPSSNPLFIQNQPIPPFHLKSLKKEITLKQIKHHTTTITFNSENS